MARRLIDLSVTVDDTTMSPPSTNLRVQLTPHRRGPGDLSFVGPNHRITVDDLRLGGADEARPGDIVLLRTDWTDRMYGKWPDYFTQSPYFPPESAEWLVARGPKNIGFDFFEEYCARLPDFTSEDFPMHRVILGAGVVIMEGLTNLGALPRRRVDFYAPFYKIAGTDGAPARFFAAV
jgi:kynurenine formamidase